jgi:hypothetical protein
MKNNAITELTLKNVRSHVDTTISCLPINVVLGDHGSGKSSIAWMIEALLTGVLPPIPYRPGTEKRGYDLKQMIRLGQSGMTISGKIGGAVITRMVNTKNHVIVRYDGIPYQGPDAEAWIEAEIGNQQVLSAVLNASTFLQLNPVQQKALLAKALTGEPVPVAPNILKAGDGYSLPKTVLCASQVDDIYKRLFEARTKVKQDLKSLGDFLPPDLHPEWRSLEECDNALRDLRQQKDDAISLRSTKLAPWERAQQNAQKQKARRVGIDAELARILPSIMSIEDLSATLADAARAPHVEKLDREIASLTAMVEANAPRLAVVNRLITEAGTSLLPDGELARLKPIAARVLEEAELGKAVQAAFSKVSAARTELEAARVKSECCPTCKRKWENIEQLTARWENAKTSLVAAEQELTTAQNAVAALGDPSGAAGKIAAHESAIGQKAELVKELNALTDKQGRLSTLRIQRQTLVEDADPFAARSKVEVHNIAEARRKELEAELSRMGVESVSQPDVSDEDDEIDTINTRVQRVEEMRKNVLELEGQKKQYEKITENVLKYETEIGILEELVQYFSDKGPLKSELIGGKLPAFKARMNEALARFGFSCQFELDPYECYITDLREGSSMSLDIAQLCETKQYRFSIAFAVAMAKATGINIVVVDCGDRLLGRAKDDLIELLSSSGLDQAWLFAATDKPAPPSGHCDDDMQLIYLTNANGETTAKVIR